MKPSYAVPLCVTVTIIILGMMIMTNDVFRPFFVSEPTFLPMESRVLSGWQPRTGLCSYPARELNRLIWSHRATGEVGSVDGSQEVTKNLLDGGVVNFDIDVVFLGDKEEARSSPNVISLKSFHVAHPSKVDKYKADGVWDKVQTLSDFLKQVETHANIKSMVEHGKMASSFAAPLISIEPKFEDEYIVRGLVKALSSCPFARHHSIPIAINSKKLNIIESELDKHTGTSGESGAKKAGNTNGRGALTQLHAKLGLDPSVATTRSTAKRAIGVPLRSAKSPLADFFWSALPNWHLKQSVPQQMQDVTEPKPTTSIGKEGEAEPLDEEAEPVSDGTIGAARSSISPISSIAFGQHCVDCCTPAPHYSFGDSYAQVVFVDQKLLAKRKPPQEQTHGDQARGSAISSICRRVHSLLVTWIVDEAEVFWKQLDMDVQGVITNKPLLLLREVKERHAQQCKQGDL